MENEPILSLCMPTNGVVEWVFPVLDSIFNQNVDDSLFEVVITDNGHNKEFKEKIKKYRSKHLNIVYVETDALLFLNEIESYKMAKGQFIKFVNHRTKLVQGALNKLISFVQENINEKPIIYFSNGVLEIDKMVHVYNSFDLFVKNLSYWSSWSTGMAIWKSDFENIPKDMIFNELFPHTTILFRERNRNKYIIDNTIIMYELPTGNIAKGKYDWFGAFGIEYPGILCDLLREGSISSDTFRFVADKNLEFISESYVHFFIRRKPCSYDLSGLNNMFGVYYTKGMLYKKITKCVVNKICRKFKKH